MTHPPPTILPFAFSVRAYVREGLKEQDMITKLFCWHNPHSSFYGKRVDSGKESGKESKEKGKGIFTFECDTEGVELRDMQFMAMCDAPDITDTINLLQFGPNVKDIHVTTGRLGILDLLEARQGKVAKCESFDSAQRGLTLVIEACELPASLRSAYASRNAQAAAHLRQRLPGLQALDQARVDRLNEQEITVADEANKALARDGLGYHSEGVLGGACLTIWNNTVDLSMVYLQNALSNKIERHYPCPADSFGLAMTCLKVCGVGVRETVDAGIAAQFMRSFPCMVASAITYASDLKRSAQSGEYELSEDISTPMSDNVWGERPSSKPSKLTKRRAAVGPRVNGHGMRGVQRAYHDSVFFDDCEGDASILKVCFGMVQKLCRRAGGLQEKELGSFAADIKQFGIMKEWSLEDIRHGLVQCRQLHEHLKDSDILLLLMSAKAPNVEKSEEQMVDGTNAELVYDICGHCAAMTRHGGSFSLAEMTAPVYMLPFDEPVDIRSLPTSLPRGVTDLMKRSYSRALQLRKAMASAGISGTPMLHKRGELKQKSEDSPDDITEDMLYNMISNDLAPEVPPSKTWMHMKKIDDVFWHIGGILGGKMLVAPDGKTVGMPIKDLIQPGMVDRVKAVSVRKTPEEQAEFDFVTTYATPPILPYVKLFQGTVSPPLQRSVYPAGVPVVPVVYSCSQDKYVERVEAWARQDPDTRYTCRIGKSTLGVLALPRCSMEGLRGLVSTAQKKFSIQ
jgi:hypothetical protein